MNPAPPVTTILIGNPSSSAQVESGYFRQWIAIIREWTFKICEKRQSLISFRSDDVGVPQRPRKGDVRVIHANSAFTRRRIIVGYLVQHGDIVLQRDEAVRESGRNQKLLAVVA